MFVTSLNNLFPTFFSARYPKAAYVALSNRYAMREGNYSLPYFNSNLLKNPVHTSLYSLTLNLISAPWTSLTTISKVSTGVFTLKVRLYILHQVVPAIMHYSTFATHYTNGYGTLK